MNKRQPQTAEPYLEVRDMTRRFGAFQALFDVDVSVFVKRRWGGQDPIETEGVRMNSSSRTIDPKELMSVMDSGEAAVVIDVRRKDDYNADPQIIPGAVWKDPNLVSQWGDELPKGKKVVVYCVRGGSVSNAVLDHLLARNARACYIQGGITAWKEQGGPLTGTQE